MKFESQQTKLLASTEIISTFVYIHVYGWRQKNYPSFYVWNMILAYGQIFKRNASFEDKRIKSINYQNQNGKNNL